MSRCADRLTVAFGLFLFAGACSSQVNPGGVPGTGGAGAGGAGAGGVGGQPVICCPPDPVPSSCMHLGGAAINGMCYEVCDFYGSSNWRIETDDQGCPFWRYDIGTCPSADAAFLCPDASFFGDSGAGGAGGHDAGSPPDAPACCPPGPIPAPAPLITGVYLGGPYVDGLPFALQCGPSWDFYCTTNWRFETDSSGCPELRWDHDPSCNLDAAVSATDAGGGN